MDIRDMEEVQQILKDYLYEEPILEVETIKTNFEELVEKETTVPGVVAKSTRKIVTKSTRKKVTFKENSNNTEEEEFDVEFPPVVAKSSKKKQKLDPLTSNNNHLEDEEMASLPVIVDNSTEEKEFGIELPNLPPVVAESSNKKRKLPEEKASLPIIVDTVPRKLSFKETLFSVETSDEDNHLRSQLEFRLNWNNEVITEQDLISVIKGNSKGAIKDFLKNPENKIRFKFCKKMPLKDFHNLLNIIPKDGWCGYRALAHLVCTLSTVPDNENRYATVINTLDHCRRPVKDLCDRKEKKSNMNNLFHAFWFEIINELRNIINKKDEEKNLLNMNWTEACDDFLTKLMDIFETDKICTVLDFNRYLDISEIECLRLIITNMEKYKSLHNIKFYVFGGLTQLMKEEKGIKILYLYTGVDGDMHLYEKLNDMTPETCLLNNGSHFSLMWEPTSFEQNNNKYNCLNSNIKSQSSLLDSLLEKLVEQMTIVVNEADNIQDVHLNVEKVDNNVLNVDDNDDNNDNDYNDNNNDSNDVLNDNDHNNNVNNNNNVDVDDDDDDDDDISDLEDDEICSQNDIDNASYYMNNIPVLTEAAKSLCPPSTNHIEEYVIEILKNVRPSIYHNQELLQIYFVHNFDQKRVTSFTTFFEEYQRCLESLVANKSASIKKLGRPLQKKFRRLSNSMLQKCLEVYLYLSKKSTNIDELITPKIQPSGDGNLPHKIYLPIYQLFKHTFEASESLDNGCILRIFDYVNKRLKGIYDTTSGERKDTKSCKFFPIKIDEEYVSKESQNQSLIKTNSLKSNDILLKTYKPVLPVSTPNLNNSSIVQETPSVEMRNEVINVLLGVKKYFMEEITIFKFDVKLLFMLELQTSIIQNNIADLLTTYCSDRVDVTAELVKILEDNCYFSVFKKFESNNKTPLQMMEEVLILLENNITSKTTEEDRASKLTYYTKKDTRSKVYFGKSNEVTNKIGKYLKNIYNVGSEPILK
jgi:hypothetical protein